MWFDFPSGGETGISHPDSALSRRDLGLKWPTLACAILGPFCVGHSVYHFFPAEGNRQRTTTNRMPSNLLLPLHYFFGPRTMANVGSADIPSAIYPS